MKKIILLLTLLAAVSFAQSVDTVILVSDVTSVDMLIAKAAGEKTGVPVLVLAGGVLDDAIRSELASLNVKTVVLVGGPVVIKEEVQTELSAKYEIVRLWGHERTGTAVEVAKYFWNGGADCVVVADDTKSSETDTGVQAEASESASVSGCPFIPVPAGTVPAEVLETVNSLGVSEAKFVGRRASVEFRSKFAGLRLKEIVGTDEQIEDEVENEIEGNATQSNAKLKLVIVAAPHWRDTLGHGGHAGRHALVRIVASADAVPRLASLIREKSITDVRVVGRPALAEEIAAGLAAEGINVTKVSGENSADVSRKALRDSLKQWEDRKKNAINLDAAARARMKAHLAERLAALESRLNNMESELESLKEEGADANEVAALQAKIDSAQNQISAIQTYIDNNNFDTANARIAKLFDDVERARLRGSAQLRINRELEVRNEEGSLEDVEGSVNVAAVETRLAALRERCSNTTSIEALIEKAKSLRQSVADAKAAGDFNGASGYALELRNLVERAKHLSNVCERSGRIDSKLTTATNQIVKRAEDIRTRTSISGARG